MKIDPEKLPEGISLVNRADGRVLLSVQWRENGKTCGTTITVKAGEEKAALDKAIALRAEHATAPEPKQTLSIRLTREEKGRLNQASRQVQGRSLESWSRETLLAAADNTNS